MSRDIKQLTVDNINDGMERAIKRSTNRLRNEIFEAEKEAIKVATNTAMDAINRIDNQTYHRITRIREHMENRIETMQLKLGARIDENARETNRRLTEIDRRHTDALYRFSKDVNHALEQHHRNLVNEVNRIDRNISVMNDNMNVMNKNINVLNNGLTILNSNLKTLANEVDRGFRQQQEEINSLNRDVKTLFDMRQNDENNKLLAAGQALALLEAVRERTEVQRFAPPSMLEKVTRMEMRLQQIAQNPDSCTISDANNLWDETLVMENEAIRNKQLWLARQTAAETAVDALLRVMQENMQLKITSIYDETQQEELQADYWTHGAYSRLEDEVKHIKQRIDSQEADIEELEQLMRQLAQMEEQATQLREQATELGMLSERRVLVTNDILNVMLAQGWELKDEPGYMGGETDEDAREGTMAVLTKAVSGEELSILILPEEENGRTVNKITFHRNDERVEAPGAFMMRMEQIRREIEKSGNKLGALGEPGCGGDGKVKELKDTRRLKRAGAAKEVNEALKRRRG